MNILWSLLIATICNNRADSVANETFESSRGVTDVITDTFTTLLVKYKKLPDTSSLKMLVLSFTKDTEIKARSEEIVETPYWGETFSM